MITDNPVTAAPSAVYTNNSSDLIWVIDDDVALRMILEDTLTDAGFQVQTFGQAKLAWQALQNPTHDAMPLPQVIITDIRMPIMDGLTFSEKMHGEFPDIPVIIMTAHADVQSAVDSYQTGAFDYLPKPFDLDEAVAIVQKALRQHAPKSTTTTTPAPSNHTELDKTTTIASNDYDNGFTHNPSGIIGQSMAIQKVFRAIGRLSNTPITVLITGESGTGKELIANALHEHSPRKHKPFIALNMAAIPHDLIEAELFGHEKGAFTGATTTRQGRFEQAHGGTLFLDEIGDMPLPTQTRLLRVLANGEFFRVGGQKPIKVDVRIIAATHQHLESLVKQGKFREDLFYRLNVIRLSLPALRERREDIPLLVKFFMQDIAKKMQMPLKAIAASTMQVLQAYDWQGNVRQLENVCRWLTVMATGNEVQINDLPPEILQFYEQSYQNQADTLSNHYPKTSQRGYEPNPALTSVYSEPKAMYESSTATASTNFIAPSDINTADTSSSASEKIIDSQDWLTPLQLWAKTALENGQQDILQTAVPAFEKCLLQVALKFTNNHKGQSAELLGWGRNTLTRKYQQLIDASAGIELADDSN